MPKHFNVYRQDGSVVESFSTKAQAVALVELLSRFHPGEYSSSTNLVQKKTKQKIANQHLNHSTISRKIAKMKYGEVKTFPLVDVVSKVPPSWAKRRGSAESFTSSKMVALARGLSKNTYSYRTNFEQNSFTVTRVE